MIDKKGIYNPWTSEDEKEHPTSAMEWWCIEGFLKTVDGKRKWNIKVALNEWQTKDKKIGSNFVMTIFDLNNKQVFDYDKRDDTKRLESSTKNFYIKFGKSWIKGSFPRYEMHFDDPKNGIEINMRYNAKSYPRWVAQEITNGWLPAGLGFYRYGFVPKCDVNGTLKIKNKTYEIMGEGYFEHVWGNFTYHRAGLELGGLKKSLSTYSKLIGWWKQNHNIKIPKTITLSTDNNPLGYDWAWALLDNGWSLFYGNALFWIMEGPSAGSLILSKDGKSYQEYGDVNFEYTKIKYAEKFDFSYPTEFKIIAKNGNEKLHLTFTMTEQIREYAVSFNEKRFWRGLVICESPGEVYGYYSNDKEKIKLNGICKIEPQRQVSALGHNTLKITFFKPPKSVGISLDIHSHFIKRRILTAIQFLPKPKLSFNIKKI